MTKFFLPILLGFCCLNQVEAQLSPAITEFLQNTTQTGTYYVSGNSTAISNGTLVNCQQVDYSATYAYITTEGIPAYPTGPFLDGNPSQATARGAIFQIPLNPVQNTGTPTSTNGGNIGIFVNGVALFDFRDGVGWNSNTNSLCGGPGNTPCPGGPMASTDWSRDAVPNELPGFDCSKGHPAMGNYHHHQNPSSFKLDQNVTSNICNLYDADGLYTIDSMAHSPLIGFAYDGFPIYGAYGYKNANGTGGITRIKSGYELRNISVRTHHADGTNVDDGPAVSTTYYLGYFREDYEWISYTGEEYLDVHNGRFCVTPEYPNGTYAYFATVNSDWTSAYPYVVGPTFYGVSANRSIASITETVTTYVPNNTSTIQAVSMDDMNINVFPSPASNIIAIQVGGLVKEDLQVELLDITGRQIKESRINKGQTLAYFDVKTLYNGTYLIKISDGRSVTTKKVIINR